MGTLQVPTEKGNVTVPASIVRLPGGSLIQAIGQSASGDQGNAQRVAASLKSVAPIRDRKFLDVEPARIEGIVLRHGVPRRDEARDRLARRRRRHLELAREVPDGRRFAAHREEAEQLELLRRELPIALESFLVEGRRDQRAHELEVAHEALSGGAVLVVGIDRRDGGSGSSRRHSANP